MKPKLILNDTEKELKRLSDQYELIYEIRYVPSILADGMDQHIGMWIPYTVCDEILSLLVEASGTEEKDDCNAYLGTNDVCIDLNEMFDNNALDIQFIQVLSGIKLENQC